MSTLFTCIMKKTEAGSSLLGPIIYKQEWKHRWMKHVGCTREDCMSLSLFRTLGFLINAMKTWQKQQKETLQLFFSSFFIIEMTTMTRRGGWKTLLRRRLTPLNHNKHGLSTEKKLKWTNRRCPTCVHANQSKKPHYLIYQGKNFQHSFRIDDSWKRSQVETVQRGQG